MMMESWSFNSLWRRNNMQLTTFVIAVSIIAAALPVKSSPVAAYDSSYYPPPPPVYSPPAPETYYAQPPPVYSPPQAYNPPSYNPPETYYASSPPNATTTAPPMTSTTTPAPSTAYPHSDGYLEVYQMQHPGYYNSPSEEYSQPPAENYYSPTPQSNYPTPAPANYNPPQNNYYQAPPQTNYYQPPPPEVYNSPQPIYYSPPAPVNYVPTPQYPPPPPYYNQPQYYPEKSTYQVEKLNYDAVTYRELNVSAKCGLFIATNDELYKDAYNKKNVNSPDQYGTALFEKDDVNPFGSGPWRVIVTDEYNNYLCRAAIIHNRQLLTLASCIQGRSLENLRVRYGDWDILNDVNEYEAYKNYETRICRTLPVACPSTYGYSDSVGQLILLQVDFIEDYDKYPHIKPVCLPEWPYNPPAYSPPPTYYQPTYYPKPEVYTECVVDGYYSSPTIELKNHKPPQPVSDNYYSYPAKDYNPYAANYYPEKSKLPRYAQVKRVEQYQQPPQYGYKSAQCDEEQQWVGVNGYDACVADVGSPIVCLVPEDETYESGYESNEAPYGGQTQYQQPPQYETYPPYKEIKAAPSPDKEPRRRYIIVGVVKSTTDCTNYEEKSQYDPRVPQDNAYERQQSRPITAVKVSTGVVDNILDKFWEGALDESCPAPKSSYPEPNYYPETKVYKPDPPAYSVLPYPAPIYSRPPQYSLPPMRPPYRRS